MTRWLVCVLLVTTAHPAFAQSKRPFEELGRYLAPGAPVFAVERAEGAIEGTVVSVSPDVVVVRVADQERRLTKDSVAWLETSPDRLWDGAAAGGLLGFAIGLAPGAFGCGECLLLSTAVGAALGAGLDARVSGRRMVYGQHPTFGFRRAPPPVSSLGGLWMRVDPGERLRVRDASGTERRGTFVKASAEAITLRVSGADVTLQAPQVTSVRARVSGRPLALWTTLAAGGLAGYFRKHEDYNRHATREDTAKGLVLGGLIGLPLWGGLAPYSELLRAASADAPRLTLSPLVGRGRVGASLVVQH